MSSNEPGAAPQPPTPPATSTDAVPEPRPLADAVRDLTAVLPAEVVEIFRHAMATNLREVAQVREDGTVFVLTGDIPAMWLRDSAAQLRPYVLLCAEDPALQDLLLGVLRRQLLFLLTDPYANSFTDVRTSRHADDLTDAGPVTWERKFELDSLCFPVDLAHQLWRTTGRTDHLDAVARDAFRAVLDTLETEQDHEARSSYRFQRLDGPPTDTLVREGRGRETAPCGLVWSGFRPSDDACELGYNIPGNMFVAVAAGQIAEIADQFLDDPALAERALRLSRTVREAVETYGVATLPDGSRVYAYEVDGRGDQLLMDDANMPSLLSAPLTGYLAADDPRYLATRAFVLSPANPYFYRGARAAGVGSPHTPPGYVWPIALSVQGLTTLDPAESRACLDTLAATTAGTGRMHESFDPDAPEDFTRPWFSWSDAMLSELVLRQRGQAG
ncbi:glycoside hydrolase family 125 protein [Microlunatus capsulatus]|uniref:glycoside hydrolase family 125 protein n=1 Tax=Microlunatus capsulatus TaxID=99117 RepID=UPI0031CF86DD